MRPDVPPHGAQSAPWGPRRSGATSAERGPHRASCARWGAIPGVFERGATQPAGMQRRPNAAGLSPLAAGPTVTSRSMAGGRTAIEGGFRAGLDEFPVIIHIPQRESQHAVRGDSLSAVGCDPHEGIRGGTARTHDELPDSGGWIRQAVGILRIESFVSVMVTVQHDVGAGAVQKAPQVAQDKSITTPARREAREVE